MASPDQRASVMPSRRRLADAKQPLESILLGRVHTGPGEYFSFSGNPTWHGYAASPVSPRRSLFSGFRILGKLSPVIERSRLRCPSREPPLDRRESILVAQRCLSAQSAFVAAPFPTSPDDNVNTAKGSPAAKLMWHEFLRRRFLPVWTRPYNS